MAIVFQTDEKTGKGVRRIARELVSDNLSDLANAELSEAKKIHECRKRCKRLRALIRLVRPTSRKYFRREDRYVRDASRLLSGHRDDTAVLESMEKLMAWAGPEEQRFLAPMVERLAASGKAADSGAGSASEALAVFRLSMEEAQGRTEEWKVKGNGFGVIAAGLRETYRRARNQWKAAKGDASDERLHEWRKEVKYHRYQVKMVSPVWPALLGAWHDETVVLSELLGDDHDLAVLATRAAETPDFAGGTEMAMELSQLVANRRAVLRHEAFALAEKMFVVRPGELEGRLGAWWASWERG